MNNQNKIWSFSHSHHSLHIQQIDDVQLQVVHRVQLQAVHYHVFVHVVLVFDVNHSYPSIIC